MELKQIKELMTAMGRCNIKRLVLKKDDVELELEKEESGAYRTSRLLEGEENQLKTEAALRRATSTLPPLKGEKEIPSSEVSLTPSKPSEETGVYIPSPMVGTFYSSPSPDEPPFVKVGDKIDKQQVVCIIEAMKVMNEVKSSVSGTVAEILVENGHPVEFGTKLFRIT